MTSPTPDQLKETDPPASAPAATAKTSTPLVVAALLAFALLYGLLAAVGVGMLGYQSLVEADVIDLWLLPRWLHGVLADALAIGALAIALWNGPRLSQWLAAALFWLGTSLLAIQGLSLHMSASWLTPQAAPPAGADAGDGQDRRRRR